MRRLRSLILERLTMTENDELLKDLARTVLTLEKAMDTMYKLTMENHKRLNRLENEFLSLEKKLNKVYN